MQEIKVLVPEERVTEFYRWFADWTDNVETHPLHQSAQEAPAEADSSLGIGAAVRWWRSLTPKERGVWGIWIDAAPNPVSADQIVAELGLGGPREIPGILSWSSRKGKKAGFSVEWMFDYDAGQPIYGLVDVAGLKATDYADLIRRARAEVQG